MSSAARNNEEATAYHEAGHALVAYVLRRQLTGASIERGEGSLGAVSTSDVKDNQWRRRWKDVTIGYAGLMAQGIRTGKRNRLDTYHDEQGAFSEIRALLEARGEEPTDDRVIACAREAARTAYELVKTYWFGVEAVASALLVRRCMSGRAVTRLLDHVFVEQGVARPRISATR